MSEATRRDAWPLWASAEQPGGPNDEGLPKLTPYLLQGTEARAAVVVCPGGGYGTRAAHEGEPVAQWLNELGLHAFVLDYRVAPHRHPLPLGDAQRALRLVRHRAAEWRVDPGRVGILGFSAGGHLAASASTHFDGGNPEAEDAVERQSCRPDASILCYAVISFLQFPHLGSVRNLLGDGATLAQRKLLSAELQVTAETPPAFLWHTAADQGVPVENSLLYASALARHDVPFSLHVFPKGRHGIGLAAEGTERYEPEASAWTRLCGEWLKGLGWVELT